MLSSKTFTQFVTIAALVTGSPTIVVAAPTPNPSPSPSPVPTEAQKCPDGTIQYGDEYAFAGNGKSCYCVHRRFCKNPKTGQKLFFSQIVSIGECFKHGVFPQFPRKGK